MRLGKFDTEGVLNAFWRCLICLCLWGNDAVVSAAEPSLPRVLVMGDSIAAGYGLDPGKAFPAQLQRFAVEHGIKVEIVNAGLSGETSAGGARRISWLLRQHVDIFVLELGGNDALRGLAVNETEVNLTQIITRARERYPTVRIVLAGMKAPPNLGPDFTSRFEALYPRVASATGSILIPFVLDGVAGVPELNQPDGIHPTVEGQAIIAKTVWGTLEPLLRALRNQVEPTR
jgi:acyl-CoA thioesterase-1